jgi:hypothetical protein
LLTSRSIVALTLIWALLLCHGAFGALHEFGEQGLPHPPDHALADYALAGHAGGHQTEGPGTTGGEASVSSAYAAVLVILMLGAAALLLLWTVARPAPASHALANVRAPALFSHRARGPSPPLLQVFRL